MSLAHVPAGCTVLVDANILLYHARGASAEASAFLERCCQGDLTGVITSIVLAEFCHRRMMIEASQAGLTASNPARTLAQRPELVRTLSAYAHDVRNLIDGGLFFEAIQKEDFILALELQHRHSLLTNDSLNLAAARRLAIKDLATADQNFGGLTGITLHRPADLAVG
jgi:predicted nucleic acid-binding protein